MLFLTLFQEKGRYIMVPEYGNSFIKRWFFLLLTAGLFGGAWAFSSQAQESSVISSPIGHKEAQRVFSDKKAPGISRRRAFRSLAEGKDSQLFLFRGIKDPDPGIRKYALYLLLERYGDSILDRLLKETAPFLDADMKKLLLAYGRRMKDPALKKKVILAAKADASGFNFYRENIRLKDDPTYDHDLLIIRRISLPRHGWKFAVDPGNTGHKKGFFRKDFNDANWKNIRTDKPWESQGFRDYNGVAWYRLRFRMPEKKEGIAAELFFRAVDESAWVWLNGKYIGQHDEGPLGWDDPFHLDISREINWNGENILVVRVLDTIYGGGIYQNICVEILK